MESVKLDQKYQLNILIYSKDRPFQLNQLLKTLKTYTYGNFNFTQDPSGIKYITLPKVQGQ